MQTSNLNLRPLATVTVLCLVSATHMILSPSAQAAPTLVFTSPFVESYYTLESASSTGAALNHPMAQSAPSLMDYSDRGPDGKMYLTNGSALWAFDATIVGGSTQHIADFEQTVFSGLAWSPLGELYLANSSKLYLVDPVNGATLSTVAVPSKAHPITIKCIDFGPDGTLYAANIAGDLFTIDPTTGGSNQIYDALISTHGIIDEIDAGSDGILRLLSTNKEIFSFDPRTGVGEWSPWSVNDNGVTIQELRTLASIPEPAPATLLAIGGIVSFAFALRKRIAV